jgi:hypothetical protein
MNSTSSVFHSIIRNREEQHMQGKGENRFLLIQEDKRYLRKWRLEDG